MREIDGYFGEVKRFCKNGDLILNNGERIKKMKVSMYVCDGCEKPVKDKKEFGNSFKFPTEVKGKDGKIKIVKKVKQLCSACATKFEQHTKGFFK